MSDERPITINDPGGWRPVVSDDLPIAIHLGALGHGSFQVNGAELGTLLHGAQILIRKGEPVKMRLEVIAHTGVELNTVASAIGISLSDARVPEEQAALNLLREKCRELTAAAEALEQAASQIKAEGGKGVRANQAMQAAQRARHAAQGVQ